MEILNSFFEKFSAILWGWPMIIMLLGTHLYLTIRLGFPQRRIIEGIRLSFAKDNNAKGDVSQFGALATALAATIGTGNIIGVAIAVAMGGPGAVLWCWLTGVFGIATKYSEGLLAVKYRETTPDGRILGGPMYALEKGLGMKWMGILFAILTAAASFGIGCTVQANAITSMFSDSYGISPYIIGGISTVLVTLVIVGGVKSISKVCSTLVPTMALLYMIGCLVILVINSEFVWPAIQLICKSAFNPQSMGGGLAGGTVMLAARYGIARGLFSNESGLGSAPIVAAAAKTDNPVRQALVSSTGTFWDTVVICAMTGIVIVSSILAYPEIDVTSGAALTKAAFSKIPYVGTPLLSFGLFTFAFSTILGWSYYGERAVEYLKGQKWMYVYRIIFIALVFVGSIASLNVVWNAADCFNALMAIPNLLSLLLLSNVIVKETQDYYKNRKQ